MRTTISTLVLLASFALNAQFQSIAPVCTNEYLTVDYNTNEAHLKLFNIEGELRNSLKLPLTSSAIVRGIQQINERTYYIDAKEEGILIGLENHELSVLEQRSVPFKTNGLRNFFYYFSTDQEVYLKILQNNNIQVDFYKNGKKVSSEQSSYKSRTGKEHKGEYLYFIFDRTKNIITLQAKSNNIWFNIDLHEQTFTMHTYGRVGNNTSAFLYRFLDYSDYTQYAIVADTSVGIYQVPDFNRVSLLKNDEYFVRKTQAIPTYFYDNCEYRKVANSSRVLRSCF